MPYSNTIQILHLKSSSRGNITWDQLSERNKWSIFLAVRHLRNLEVDDAVLSTIHVLPLVLFS